MYPCVGNPPNSQCVATPTYPSGECTSGCAWWGSQYMGRPFYIGWGNADNWPAAARAAKLTVDTHPLADTIMCIPPNVNGAGKEGHVAYVLSVEASTCNVKEFNFLRPFAYDERDAVIQGCEFIHLLPKPQPKPPTPGAVMKATFFQGPDSTYWLFVPTGKGQFIAFNELAAVRALAAEWGITATPIPLNGTDVAAWRAAYPPG